MLHLNMQDLQDRMAWMQAGIRLPRYDVAAVRARAWEAPMWFHSDMGNILRGLLVAAQQTLLNAGRADAGILAAESFNFQIINQTYSPCDALGPLVHMCTDDSEEWEVIASVTGGLKAGCAGPDWARLIWVFRSPTLQMASFTTTEKGYTLIDLGKRPLPVVERDLAAGPEGPRHTMSIAVALLHRRFQARGVPIAMVSIDNYARNEEKFRVGVLSMARGWAEQGSVESAFLDRLEDEGRVSPPWSMTDKIAPHPFEWVQEELGHPGAADMAIVRTNTGTLIAPFVNAEVTEYPVLEDASPDGRSALEGAGVYLTDRTIAEKVEKMKVGTCLDPLHTALIVYGCLLGHTSIAAEMGDVDFKALVEYIAVESLPVVEDPGTLSPRASIDGVLHERFPNPAIPDTLQRIVADTLQRLPVRYDGTFRRYVRQSEQALIGLEFVPLMFADWCRYLLGANDRGNAMSVSLNPMLPQLWTHPKGIEVGRPDSLAGQLRPTPSNAASFGVDLYAAGLGERTEGMFRDMLAGLGAVRATLHHNCVCKQP